MSDQTVENLAEMEVKNTYSAEQHSGIGGLNSKKRSGHVHWRCWCKGVASSGFMR